MVSPMLRLAPDNSLLNGADEPVVLKGVGLGGTLYFNLVNIGWLNMENFITGYPSREFQIREELLNVLGKEKYDIFFDSVLSFPTHLTAIRSSSQISSLKVTQNFSVIME
jgi:hypothetical protein